jgi:hypothetical protein
MIVFFCLLNEPDIMLICANLFPELTNSICDILNKCFIILKPEWYFLRFVNHEGVDYEYKSVNPRTDPGNCNALTHFVYFSWHLILEFTLYNQWDKMLSKNFDVTFCGKLMV